MGVTNGGRKSQVRDHWRETVKMNCRARRTRGEKEEEEDEIEVEEKEEEGGRGRSKEEEEEEVGRRMRKEWKRGRRRSGGGE
jgi:hypothetical protein